MSGTDFYYRQMPDLARKLESIMPGGGTWKCFFGNSGTEAIEAAILAIKDYTPHITIGDSDSGGYNRFSMDEVYRETGILDFAKKYGDAMEDKKMLVLCIHEPIYQPKP
jgi:4-aminobutyrate aminotransferase-like enzyme